MKDIFSPASNPEACIIVIIVADNRIFIYINPQ